MTYLSNVAARFVRECQGIQPSIVRIGIDTSNLVVTQSGDNATWVAPNCVMMELEAQPIIIGKRLAQELGLTAEDLTLFH